MDCWAAAARDGPQISAGRERVDGFACQHVRVERRHQVFISSTFTDLVAERREVIEALLEMDAIPAGMELFAAGNTDQWTLIQQVIDQSDYYLVIIGGRYGSMTAEGISYTEMEYDYAVERGIPVMGFVHADPDSIPKGKSEMDPDASQKLQEFRAKVQRKIVRSYSTPAELGGVVSPRSHQTAEGLSAARVGSRRSSDDPRN